MFPRFLKEVLGSKELEAEYAEDKKGAIKHAVVATAIITAIGLPVMVVAAPPAVAIRSGRKIKRTFSSLKNWVHKEKPANDDESEAVDEDLD